MSSSKSFNDPVWGVELAPENETEHERLERQAREDKAKAVSLAIDEELKIERAALKKGGKPVKVLILGQSESGKSTTVKNFQMTYAPKAWLQERASWAAVIRLNLVRSVNQLLDILEDESSLSSSSPNRNDESPFTDKHTLLKLRLSPLRGVQKDLETRLGSASLELKDSAGPTSVLPDTKEFSIPSSRPWKLSLSRSEDFMHDMFIKNRKRRVVDVSGVLLECREDIRGLWEDPVMKALLRHRGIQLEEGSGFFLADSDLNRIAAPDYLPSDLDIIRARLRTTGVQEHHFVLESTKDSGQSWMIYDVGGSRTSRAAWLPFLHDQIQAIIFMLPLNVFDQPLAEDSRVNRLEDSYLLWKALCRSPLLVDVQLILLLNKVDLLERKLMRVRVKDFISQYKDRANDLTTAMNFFRSVFKEISLKYSTRKRDFRAHFTTLVDIKSTTATLLSVQEMIVRQSLNAAQLL